MKTYIEYIKEGYNISKNKFVLILTLYSLNAVIPLTMLALTARLIDRLSLYINDGTGLVVEIYKIFLIIVMIMVIKVIIKQSLKIMRLEMDNKLEVYFNNEILNKISRLSYEDFEEETTYKTIQRINKKFSQMFIAGLYNILHLIMNITSLALVSLVLLKNIPILLIPYIFISISMINHAKKTGINRFNTFLESENYNRKAEYFEEILTGKDYIFEKGMFGYSDYIYKKWKTQLEKYIEAEKHSIKVMTKDFSMINIKNNIINVVFFMILLLPLKKGNISLGIYISLMNTMILLISKISEELYWNYKDIIVAISMHKDYKGFINSKEDKRLKNKSGEINTFNKIEFKNVSFKYPKGNRWILKKISFCIEKNKSYAIIGENGAGKSTILKLLLGLYEYYGEILIDGVELSKISREDIEVIFEVVFQDYSKYEIHVDDFLNSSDVERYLFKEFDLEFLHGENKTLGKIEENSIELSSGQWQKLALLKAVSAKKSLVILDEPTASIDPISEKKLYDIFDSISKFNTSLLITHRLQAALNVDEILLLEGGKIVERGSHIELFQSKGRYYNMYEQQRKWYIE